MQRKEPLKEILASTQTLWDHVGVRHSVRTNFAKVLKCRTDALGSEVFASATERKVIHHTCKSRACPSCGHRATRLWQREMWSALPDVNFTGIVFTMPDVLWPIFRRNRHLLHDLPALGAAVIEQWGKDQCSARLIILVIRHTFGRHLNFNPHLHILVSAGGLRISDDVWVSHIHFDKCLLMKRWRYALVTYLRQALRQGHIASNLPPKTVRNQLTAQYERWWNVDIKPCASKEHFIRYVGRYVRRPPLAQYRILEHNADEVSFRTQDHRQHKEIVTRYTPRAFVDHLADHVHDHYEHAIRHFGLLAPRSRNRSLRTLFLQLGQVFRQKPRYLTWARSIEREYGRNPKLDLNGEVMTWLCRRRANPSLG